jgi:hypothetical protein
MEEKEIKNSRQRLLTRSILAFTKLSEIDPIFLTHPIFVFQCRKESVSLVALEDTQTVNRETVDASRDYGFSSCV